MSNAKELAVAVLVSVASLAVYDFFARPFLETLLKGKAS